MLGMAGTAREGPALDLSQGKKDQNVQPKGSLLGSSVAAHRESFAELPAAFLGRCFPLLLVRALLGDRRQEKS